MDIRKLIGRPNATDAEVEQIQKMFAAGYRPARQQHYRFAHKLLPQIVYEFGVRAAIMLGDPDKSSEMLQDLWQTAGQGLPPEHLVAPEPLSGSYVFEGEHVYTIITLPPPQSPSEAHFVGIVGGPLPSVPENPTTADAERLQEAFFSAPVQLFTLENGVQQSAERTTVFCSWTPDGQHENYGPGPSPDAETFLAFLVHTIQSLPNAQGGYNPDEGTVWSNE